jgi:hypothetical protein
MLFSLCFRRISPTSYRPLKEIYNSALHDGILPSSVPRPSRPAVTTLRHPLHRAPMSTKRHDHRHAPPNQLFYFLSRIALLAAVRSAGPRLLCTCGTYLILLCPHRKSQQLLRHQSYVTDSAHRVNQRWRGESPLIISFLAQGWPLVLDLSVFNACHWLLMTHLYVEVPVLGKEFFQKVLKP